MAGDGIQYCNRGLVNLAEESTWHGGRLTNFRRTSDRKSYARVLYSGHAVETIRSTLDWIPLSALVDLLRPYVPDDITFLCKE